MSTAAFTPGPWVVGPTSGVGICAIDANDSADGQLFAVCEVLGIDDARTLTEVALANARLIAAAPDLLSALKACLWCMESDLPPEVTEAERLAAAAAIALATGAPA